GAARAGETMKVPARRAVRSDLHALVVMYRGLEEEMTALHRMWPLADGLDEPVEESLAAAIDDPGTVFLIGEIEGVPFGFLLARPEPMLAQAKGEMIGGIQLIDVDHVARQVADSEATSCIVMKIFRSQGMIMFDGHVLPWHRSYKNFCEAEGFSVRSILMHHDDERCSPGRGRRRRHHPVR